MSTEQEEKEKAKKIARILKVLAQKIIENPNLLKDLEIDANEIPNITQRRQKKDIALNFNIYQVFADNGEEALRSRLDNLDLIVLKRIISQHSFDSSKLAEKWRNKKRLIDLIVERVSARSEKGDVFKDYDNKSL